MRRFAALAILLALSPVAAQEEPVFRGENHEIRRLELKGARIVDQKTLGGR